MATTYQIYSDHDYALEIKELDNDHDYDSKYVCEISFKHHDLNEPCTCIMTKDELDMAIDALLRIRFSLGCDPIDIKEFDNEPNTEIHIETHVPF